MDVKVLSVWESLRGSYWFVPLIMAVMSAVLALFTFWLDVAYGEVFVRHVPWIYQGGPAGARDLLSTIAGSIISVAGIVFSITIATLTLASQQFGPRLLRNFMRDIGSQVVFGTFVATFLYSLMILRTIKSEEINFVPQMSVSLSLVLAIASLGVLIYFIHHIATSLQASHVILEVGRELEETIDRLFPESLGRDETQSDLALNTKGIPDDFERDARPLLAEHDGYLQVIDTQELMRLATRHDLLLRFAARPGDFIIKGSHIALVWPPQRLTDEVSQAINGTLTIGRRRTPLQDVEFGIDQLVEVALRALSPSLNDAFTAIMCVDWLGATLARLAGRHVPSPYRVDEAGQLRVIVENENVSGIINSAFDQLRQNARGNVAVLMRLLEAIALIGEQMRDPAGRAALRRQAIMIERASRESVPEEWDRQEMQRRYEVALRALSDQPAPSARVSMDQLR